MVEVKDVTIIMQARMGSERLPGKVLKPLKDKTLLGHIITRMQKNTMAKEIIVATTTEKTDDAIEKECQRYSVKVFRGSQFDVLSRYYYAAVQYNAKHIMRFCCDNPFADYKIADKVIELYNSGSYEYVNTMNFPLGVGVEIFPFKMLEEAFNKGTEPYHREHVTPYIIENAKYKTQLICDIDYSDYRFTADTEEDWIFAETVYEYLYSDNEYFDYKDIIDLLERNPKIRDINRYVVQRNIRETQS